MSIESEDDVTAPIVLSLKREKVPVTLENEDGTAIEYFLQEMDGLQRDSYISLMSKKVNIGIDGKATGVRDFSGLQSELIVRCLVIKDTGKYADLKTVNSWKSSIQNVLFERAAKMNGLDTKSEDDAKND